jgi:hypothetical protein
MKYLLRIESREGQYDLTQDATSLEEAQELWSSEQPFLAPFDWRGAVCFTSGLIPAEERHIAFNKLPVPPHTRWRSPTSRIEWPIR